MEPRSLQFITEACGGTLISGLPDMEVRRICTDSRQATAGDLFIALVGENFDAHIFLAEVAKQGVTAVLVERSKIPADFKGAALIAVENTRIALGRLASRYRADFDPAMIAVGGSNGKTTTKELIAAVLRRKFSTLWSEASFNNDIGVPLTLLKLEKSNQAAVLEAGTNHPGELAPLLRMIRPRYSVVTSIGREHLEFFGDMTGVVQEEGALAELLPGNGTLFVNAESEWIKPLLKRARAKVVSVGWNDRADFFAKNLLLDENGVTFSVHSRREELSGEYKINLIGRHQVLNALLAIAVAGELGLSRAEIQSGLLDAKPAKMRMQASHINGICILDDTYNANADSMIAGLETLSELPSCGRRIAVLGDMAELGEQSASSHREIGQKVAELKIDHLFAVGKMAPETAFGARKGGLKSVTEFIDAETSATALKIFLKPGDAVLLKASRSSRLERIVEMLKSVSLN